MQGTPIEQSSDYQCNEGCDVEIENGAAMRKHILDTGHLVIETRIKVIGWRKASI